jgi:hypothetical protein
MAIFRRGIVPGALLVALCCCGCDLGSMLYFLMPDSKTEPEMRRLASDDKNKEVRVVILVSSRGLETRPELIQADRQLAEATAKQLQERCAENQERLAIVAPRKVEEFKNSHPHWAEMAPVDIGRYFKADYLIDLEINSISLYEVGSMSQLFRGSIDLHLALIDVNRPDGDPDQSEETIKYPSDAHGPQNAFDGSIAQFRQKFLDYVARRLSWKWTGHCQTDHREEFD